MKRIIGAAVAAVAAIGVSVGTASVSAQSNEGSVYIDTVVIGGPAAPGDFTYEVGGVGGIVDSTAAQCNINTVFGDSANCSPPATLPPGTYSVSATSVAPSYVQTGLACQTNNDGTISGGGSSAEVGVLTVTLCTVTYSYVTQQIGVDVVVINDDGGTATAADVTVELRDSGGTVIATGQDPEPGTGNAMLIFTVPLGDYTVTATGPAGYTIVVDTTVVERAGDVAAGAFSVTAGQTANAVVTANDPTTTTTTTTTVAPPASTDPPASTAAPTTAAPTTAAPAALPASGDLPVTGATDQTAPIALIAVLLLGLGGGAVLAARRT